MTDSTTLEVETVSDSQWVIPTPGDTTRIRLAFRFSNPTSDTLCLRLLDTIRLRLRTDGGRVLPMDGGRDGIRPERAVSEPIAPGADFTMKWPAVLSYLQDRSIRLSGEDEFGGIWYVDGISAGRHWIEMEYTNRNARAGEPACVWTGSIIAPPFEVALERKHGNN